jgi:hypothetical protein
VMARRSRSAPQLDHAALLAAGLSVLAVLAVSIAIVLSGDDSPPPPEPAPELTAAPVPMPEPEPEPPPPPVSGQVEEVVLVDVSVSGRQVFGDRMPQDEPIEPDEETVEALTTAVTAWLDEHLTDLQDGGTGLTGAALEGSHETMVLTHPDAPVEQAVYAFTVYVRGAAEWASVTATVTRTDGEQRTATFAFLPGEPPDLVAAEGDGEFPPASTVTASADDDAQEQSP